MLFTYCVLLADLLTLATNKPTFGNHWVLSEGELELEDIINVAPGICIIPMQIASQLPVASAQTNPHLKESCSLSNCMRSLFECSTLTSSVLLLEMDGDQENNNIFSCLFIFIPSFFTSSIWSDVPG